MKVTHKALQTTVVSFLFSLKSLALVTGSVVTVSR